MHLTIINGPNLNLLGAREPEIYGKTTFETYLKQLQERYPDIVFSYFHSNIEGELIDQIQSCQTSTDGIILNAAGYTHTSVSIADAVSAIAIPTVEVHISNVYKRESVRHHSLLSAAVCGTIGGFGLDVYRLAVEALLEIIQLKNKRV